MKPATALMARRIGVGVTVAIVLAELASFYLHLFVLPIFGFFPLIVVTLLPALLGIGAYNKATKPK